MKLSKMLRPEKIGTIKLTPTINFQLSTINKHYLPNQQLALLTQEC